MKAAGDVSECPKPATTAVPRIIVAGCTVRIIADDYTKLGVPKRQGFAWPKNAEAYAEQLSRDRGWPIDLAEC
jgi:hypothetical protein